MIAPAEALFSFFSTTRAARLSPQRFRDWQARALQHWLHHDLPRVPAYSGGARALADLPILDKARLMADFARLNRAGITADQVRAALAAGTTRIDGFTVGASTGTSGNRGFFVISDVERYRWLGALLAKAIPDLLWARQRIAILLPQDTRLYASARSVPHLTLRFFALAEGAARWGPALETFDPTVIVAPPKVLRHLAEAGLRLSPRRIFSAAETLDPVDRPVIEAAFRLPLDQIYMATEGLLAVTCRAGNLHLAEDSVHFEFERVPGSTLVSPLITAFRRQVQILARYRMNDLLRLSNTPCPCGSPLQVVTEVAGRMDDCFRLASATGGPVLVTPDTLRNAVITADPRITDFRLRQRQPALIELTLPPDLPPEAGNAATTALTTALARLGATPRIDLVRAPLAPDYTAKLRRVECCLPKGGPP